jgi:hypothetical protein
MDKPEETQTQLQYHRVRHTVNSAPLNQEPVNDAMSNGMSNGNSLFHPQRVLQMMTLLLFQMGEHMLQRHRSVVHRAKPCIICPYYDQSRHSIVSGGAIQYVPRNFPADADYQTYKIQDKSVDKRVLWIDSMTSERPPWVKEYMITFHSCGFANLFHGETKVSPASILFIMDLDEHTIWSQQQLDAHLQSASQVVVMCSAKKFLRWKQTADVAGDLAVIATESIDQLRSLHAVFLKCMCRCSFEQLVKRIDEQTNILVHVPETMATRGVFY